MLDYIFLILFFIVVIIELYGEIKENFKITIIFKALLMPMLIFFYLFGAPFGRIDWFIVVALIFGLGGDILLGLKNQEKWFLFGMLSFLLNQIFYIISFFLSISNIALFPLWGLFLLGPVILIIIINVPKFINKTEKMKIPVLVYMAAILLMHLAAIFRLAQYSGLPFIFIYMGSVLFVFSDSFVAIEAFGEKFSGIRIVVMTTYTLAQFYITLGALLTSLL
ncbi:MAG: lysoplasmalogenase [Candidatus Heimdallarchaeota archaeon]